MGLFYQVCGGTPDLEVEELRRLLVDAQALAGAVVDAGGDQIALRDAQLVGREIAAAITRSMTARGFARESVSGLAEACAAITAIWTISTLPSVSQTPAVQSARRRLEETTQGVIVWRRRDTPPVILRHEEEDRARSIALWVVGAIASSAFFGAFGYVVAKVRKQLPPLTTKRRRR